MLPGMTVVLGERRDRIGELRIAVAVDREARIALKHERGAGAAAMAPATAAAPGSQAI